MGDQGKKYAEDKAIMEQTLRGEPFRKYDAYFCLAREKRHGVCVLVKKGLDKPIRVARTLSLDGSDETVDEIDTCEGRVLLLEFEKLIVLNTYVPHNGSNPERWQKRALWDFRVQKFLKYYKGKKDIIWMGDLNVAHRELDVSSPSTMTEWGGFTLPERRRFTDILADSEMVDAYRELHGDRQTFTWRGGSPIGGGWSGMRLDYYVVPKTFVHRLKTCETSTDIFDDETARTKPVSCFFGSDHCALYLTLHKRDQTATATTVKHEEDEQKSKRAKPNNADAEDVIVLSP